MRLYKLTLLIEYFLDSALSAGSDYMLHLHCLHCEDSISFFKFCALLGKYFGNCSWHGSHCFFSPSFILTGLFSVIWLEFEASWVSFGIKKIDSILLNMELNFPDLAIDNNIKFPRFDLAILELKMVFTVNHSATFIISKLCRQSNMLIILHLNGSLINGNVMQVGRSRHVSEVK